MGGPAKLHSDLEALVGTVIHDRYRVESLLGVGGMGAVFRGHHVGLRRAVAIKVLHPEIGRDESTSKRFDREATSASRLDHPNCVRVTDFGSTENGTKYLVMEFLEGRELKDSMGQALPPARAVQIAIQIFQALEHAHHFGVVHRDLKPENVYMTTDFRGHEVVKLVDFGIAKLIDEQGAQEKLTRAGLVFGTPRYMSPEQAAGGKIDERTDLYAAGLILYEMLCGHVPFDADDPAQLLRMQILAPPPALPSSVPTPLAKVVEKLLEKSKSDRHSSAREVIDVLAPLERELASTPAPAAPIAAAPVVVPIVAPFGADAPTQANAATAQRSASSWQPVAPTSSLPAPPPPAPNLSGMHFGAAPPPAAPSFPSIPAPPPPAPSFPTSTAPTPPGSSFAGMPVSATTPTAPSLTPDTYPSVPSSQIMVATTSRDDRRRTWLPWLIVAAALFIALMAIGALLSSKESSPDASPTEASPSSPFGADDRLTEEELEQMRKEREKERKKAAKHKKHGKKGDDDEEDEHWEIVWE